MHARPDTTPNPTDTPDRIRGRGDAGSTMVEYALLIALIALVAAGALTFLGNRASTALDNAGSSIAATSSTAAGGAGSSTTTSPTTTPPSTTTPPTTAVTTPPTTAPAPTTTTTVCRGRRCNRGG